MAQDNVVQGNFDNYDDCNNCNNGWEKNNSRLVCNKCGGLGMIKKR